MSDYPKFYRKEGRCLKQESAITGMQVIIPEPGKSVPLSHTIVIMPSEARMAEEIAHMEPCDQEVYEDYLATFYQVAEGNRKIFNDYRQKKFERSRTTNNEQLTTN